MDSRLRVLVGSALALITACVSEVDTDSTSSASSELADRARVSAYTAPDPHTTQVTLITGDHVVLTRSGGGAPVISVVAAPGRERVQFVSRVVERDGDDDVIVLPDDAAPLVVAGRLDPELFNVSTLVREGLDDARASALPVIVTYSGAPLRSLTATGARPTRWLGAIRGEAVVTDRRNDDAFWRWLTDSGSPRAAAAQALTAGVAKVWLDRRAQLMLDASAAQIGAPAAWSAGLTGAGVTVAVLDTGVRASHPDLAGAIAEAVDFTDTSPGAADDVGHGTHVAGIIAGSGAASDGRYRGIAPGARLIVGRVCTAGGCPFSSIIAGMEWAAARARVVNMSLGSTAGSDGTDLLSTTVDELTARHGTLFVAAAGNTGTDQSVGAPAAADAALAVASVSKQDEMSSFSSRGPRLGDHAVKPEIAAPGGAIVAARAVGTSVGDREPVSEHYTRLSGTSMATPHVAGAAALLAQQHPDWGAAELKAALMGSARSLTGMRVVDGGAGRLDVARAIAQRVRPGVGSLSFGVAPFPHGGDVLTRTVTYHNDGDEPVALALALAVVDSAGQPAPAGLFTAPASVTVPARGSADATVTVTGQAGVTGFFSGHLVAEGDGNRVVTALDILEERERFNLTIDTLDLAGAPARWYTMNVINLDTAVSEYTVSAGPVTLRLDRGEYDIAQIVASGTDKIFAASPSVVLDRDRTVLVDGRTAKPVTAVVERPNPRLISSSLTLHSRPRVPNTGVSMLTMAYGSMYATPTPPVHDHFLALDFRTWIGSPAPAPGDAPTESYLYNIAIGMHGGIPEQLTHRVPDRDLGVVHARYFTGGDARGYRSNVGTTASNASAYVDLLPQPLPDRRTEYYSADATWTENLQLFGPDPGQRFGEYTTGHATYLPGRHVWRDWNRAPFGPSFGPDEPDWGAYRHGDRISVYLSPFTPAERDHTIWRWVGTTTLSRDGAVIGTAARAAYGVFTVPADPGVYTLDVHAERDVPWSALGTGLDATWTFASARSYDGRSHYVPLLLIDAQLAVDDHNQALAGLPALVTLEVQRQPGGPVAAITELGLDVSYDAGATWQPAAVFGSGDRAVALVLHPRTPGTVWLRARARDAAGNAVTQTTKAAYRTRALP